MDTAEKEKIISDAIRKNEAIKIKYHRGGQPGAVRILVPVELSEGIFRARYVNSPTRGTKLFSVQYAEFDFSDSEENYDFSIKKKVRTPREVTAIYSNLQEVAERHSDEVTSMGFAIKADENQVSVFSYFKNGKERKTPDIDISYSEFTYTYEYPLTDDEEVIVCMKPSTRPYAVRAKGKTTKTFKHLDSAVEHFLVCVIDQFTTNCDKSK